MATFPTTISTETLLTAIDDAIRDAGLAIALGPEVASLVIIDRQQATSWFENALLEHDAEHPSAPRGAPLAGVHNV